MAVPSSILDAQKVEFGVQVTGYLLCETYSGSRYVICHWWYENGAVPVVDLLH
jgi:hypothetical protein